ncbi:MAG: class I SAM-dependent methyltransferase [Gemmatimonadaceae bacterium]
MNRREHWERVYTTKQPTEVSWYQPTPARSLGLMREAGAGPHTSIIDIGGGDSTLVDVVLAERLGEITVLDISSAALARARTRLGERSRDITWLEGDVTSVALPPGAFDIWHDRAVFHFLTSADDCAQYATTAAAALKPGGTLIMATFATDGPMKCSGLDVMRYSAESLALALGDAFHLIRSFNDVHHTPSGAEQRFLYAVFRRQ